MPARIGPPTVPASCAAVIIPMRLARRVGSADDAWVINAPQAGPKAEVPLLSSNLPAAKPASVGLTM